MIKKIVFCFLVILCLSGCGKKQRFINICMQNSGSSAYCSCMYNVVSQNIEDTDSFINWFITINNSNLKTKPKNNLLEPEQAGIYAGLLANLSHCALKDTVFADKFGKNTNASEEDIRKLNKTIEEAFDKL